MKKIRHRNVISVVLVLLLAGHCLWNSKTNFDRYRVTNPPTFEYIHFSIDDCNDLFKDLTENQEIYHSIFDQEFLGFLKKMHESYDIVFSLYVFYDWNLEETGFDLSMATNKFQREFEENSEWLKFGYHASDADFYKRNSPQEAKEYYNETIMELVRVVGEKSIDTFVRLDRYTANEQVVDALHNTDYPVCGLLIADRADAETRSSYDLSKKEQEICYTQDWYCDDRGMCYTPTDVRLESISSDDEFYNLINNMGNQQILTIFTHEYEIEKESVQRYCEMFAQYAVEFQLFADYPQNHIG